MPITDQTLAEVRRLRATVGVEADTATRDATAAWVDGWDQVAPLYATALAGVAATAVAEQRWPGPWDLSRDEQLQTAARHAATVLSGLAIAAGAAASVAATNATEATVAAEPEIMASQVPATERHAAADTFAAAIGVAGVAALVTGVTAAVGALVSPIAAVSASAINQVLTAGVSPAAGSAQALAGRLLDGVHRGFNAGLTSAITMTRVETLDAYRTAARRVHGANSRVVASWLWTCSLDRTACPACWAMHGSEHPLSEPGPLDHRNGRCGRTVRLRPWSQLGYSLHEPADRFPDAQTLFAGLSDEDQLKVMGPARLELLRSGRIQWADLAVLRQSSNWRAAYVPRTVTALQAIAGLKALV